MHATEIELQALVDDELGSRESERVRAHLEDCAACRERRRAIEVAGRETGELLESLDRPPPRVTAEDVIRIAERRRIPSPRAPHRLPWAAAIAGLLAAGIVAAAIVPGSPVRDAVERIVKGPQPEPSPVPPAVLEPWSLEAGVALVPDDGLEIQFENTQTEGSIELVTIPGDTAKVEVRDEPVRFVVGSGSVVVENSGAKASYRISLPAAVSDARVKVGDRPLFQRVENRIVHDEFPAAGDARTILFSAILPS